MNKRALLLLVALAVVGAAVYFLLRESGPGGGRQSGTEEGEAPRVEAAKPEGQGRLLPVQSAAEVITEDDPDGDLRLEGQVVDANDLPVEAARVSINASPRKSAVTEKDGSFFFDKLIGKQYRLTARHEGSVGGPVLHQLSAKSEPVIIRLRSGAVLEVIVVVEKTGSPIEGAFVELRSTTEQSAYTDAQGRVRLSGVVFGHSTVHARASGYAPAYQLVQVPPSTTKPIAVKIALRAGARASGRVIDEQGNAIAKAQVLAVDTAALITLADADKDGAVTDETGQFKIEALTAGTYRFTATHPDRPPAESKPVRIDGRRPERGIEIVMKSGGQISGRVESDSGQPVPWARLRISRENGRSFSGGLTGARQKHATCDRDGKFEINGLPRDLLLLMGSSESASSEIVPADLRSTARVDDLVVRLTVGGEISGKVLNSDDEPVAEVHVSALADFWAEGESDRLILAGMSTAMTDGSGNFEFKGLAEGAYRLRVARSGGSRRQFLQAGVPAKTGDRDVVLRLDADGGLKGRIRFAEGGAPREFSVALTFPPGVPVSSDDGTFEIPEVAPGSFDVTFRGQDFADKTVSGIEVKPDEVTDMGVVTVVRGRTITGRVLEDNGSAVPGATVLIAKRLVGDGSNLALELGKGAEEQMGLRRALTDRDGAFRVGGVGSERYLIIAEHDKLGRSGPEVIPQGADNVSFDLILHGFGSVVGTVTSGGKPASGAVIQVNSKGEADHASVIRAGDDGGYRIERLHAGDHRVTAALVSVSGGAASMGKMVTARANQEIRVDFDIPVGDVLLVVNVQGKDDAKIDAAQVLLIGGQVSITSVDDLKTKATSSGGGILQGFWLPVKPAQFKEVTPGEFTICVIPINGNMSDPAFLQRLQQHSSHLKVYCNPQLVAPSPKQQSYTAVVPPMEPLPEGP